MNRVQRPALLVLALLATFISFALQGTTQAGHLFDSPLPGQPGPCLVLTQDGYTLEFIGYYRHEDGSATLNYRLVNDNRKDVGYIAFGVNSGMRLSPVDGSTIWGSLGEYAVEWTNDPGEPGFPSVKFEPGFSGYSQGAGDSFAVVVADFVAAANQPVVVKAGNASVLFTIPLDNPNCDRTPLPPATPTPTLDPSQPTPQVFVLTDNLYTPTGRAGDREVGEADGVPQPVPVQFTADSQLQAWVAQWEGASHTPSQRSLQESQATSGWSSYYATGFESNFLADGGPCLWNNSHPNQPRWWERDTQRKANGNYALWPAAHPTPAPTQYPNNLQVDLICRLNNMAGIENVLVEFKMWLQLNDSGDKFSVLFSGDGGNYRGIQWSGVNNTVWSTYRVYYPELVKSNPGTVYIMFSFESNGSGQVRLAVPGWTI